MSEETWAQAREWEQERGELEIKRETKLAAGLNLTCAVNGCSNTAVVVKTVGRVDHPHIGTDYELCEEHNDDDVAYDLHSNN